MRFDAGVLSQIIHEICIFKDPYSMFILAFWALLLRIHIIGKIFIPSISVFISLHNISLGSM
jgi:uncharacterized protein (UPF0254 family)